ncbi:MAG: DoxX family protein [Opitutaceae bacterium]
MSHKQLSLSATIFSWICQIAAAVILFQTLYFKFTGAPESVYIFETVGLEPFGRYASGVAEFIAGGLLLIPRVAWAGAGLAIGVMLGAIGSHLTVLGIVVMDDGGTLFALSIVVTVCSAVVLFLRREAVLGLLPIGGAK